MLITCIRHAESSRETGTLTQNGVKQALELRKTFKEVPDLVVVSPANRTIDTCRLLFDLPYTVLNCLIENGNVEDFKRWLKTRTEKHIVVVGHSSFLERFICIDNVPLCSAISLNF
jgi:phosphohistidine phosphatase SixA